VSDLLFGALSVLEQRAVGDLTSPMAFDDDFTSFQKVRNCLEHRSGIVGEPDVDE
jgi:hypothetical protein